MRKRSRYRPREILPLPLSWGTTDGARRQLALTERSALALLLEGRAELEHYRTLEAACTAAIWACGAAASGPYEFELEPLTDLRDRLVACAQALLSVRDREQRVGRYGCTGPERELLRELCDHMDSMRDQLPRRCWWEGYRLAFSGPVISIPAAT